jgi:hypothetical protein
MFPFLPMMLGGAGLGALLGKGNPLKGAALGAGAGALGGMAFPGLLGAAAPAVAGAAPAAMGAAPAAMGAALPALGAAAPGAAAAGAAAPTGLLGSAMEYAKPIGQAMQIGMGAKGLLGGSPQQQMGPSPMAPPQAPNNTLGSLASQGQQSIDQQLAQAAQERAQRRKMFGGFNARSA